MAEKSIMNASLNPLRSPDIQFAMVLLCIIFMMFIPLPPIFLDFLLSLSITFSFLIILVSIYIKEPLEFSTFPTFLLLATLSRLSLNIATTRNILLDGPSGNVSKVVLAFGDFVVGGNYFVGFVVFLILIIINFLVITKGAGRVAEVGARFTLDAMPGKQMSIDADLNAGIINREEARARRTKIEDEADFYGAMDGASKFVRGDAIAGIIITSINIIVGLSIGVFQYNMSFSQAAEVFVLLTVGDGLVSQIPAIIVSVSAGIVTTRAHGGNEVLSEELSSQIFLKPKALYLCSALLTLMSIIPGLPTISLLILAATFYFFGRTSAKTLEEMSIKKAAEEETEETKSNENSIESLLAIETLTLEVGVGLIPLVDTEKDGEVLERIVSSRKQFAQDMGVIVPMVMVRDNIQLKPGEYRILLKGNEVGRGDLMVEYELAMSPEDTFDPIDGIKTKEPAYNIDAIWIKPGQKDEAAFRGYTVVNCATVMVTHLTKVIQDYAPELLGRQEAQRLIDGIKETNPKVVDEVMNTEGFELGTIVNILKNLLAEGISIKDLLSIFEAIADQCKKTQNISILTSSVRKSLARTIAYKYASPDKVIKVVSLDRTLEDLLISGIKYHDDGETSLNIEPDIAKKMLGNIADKISEFSTISAIPLVLCGSQIRWDLKKIIARFIPGVSVISFDEIPEEFQTENLGIITV